jgi:ABC-2 type transport system permease protein
MPSRVLAIVAAQWKTLWNVRHAGGRGGRAAAAALRVLWYGMWTCAGIGAYLYTASAARPALAFTLPWALMTLAFFWQLAPILTVNLGASIQLRKLLIYPIPERELFLVELLLRVTAGVELLLVITGLTAGLLRNPAVRHWAPVPALLLFAAFNLFLAAGMRSLLERLLQVRRIREVVVFFMVLCAAVPQLLTYTGVPPAVRQFLLERQHPLLPWTAAGRLAIGDSPLLSLAVLAGWTAAAYAFGRWQFGRSLSFDSAAAHASGTQAVRGRRLVEAAYRLPGALFPDPLAALVEKELRSLARSPRFRLVLLMGFSFGMVIWWPIFHTGAAGRAQLSYPVVVCAYALVLLAQVVFWNQFGFDRAAAEIYFSTPVPFATVLRAKNFATLGFVIFQACAVLLICFVLRIPLGPARTFETFAVTLTLALYFLAAGNLSSVYYPRPVDPEHSWGGTGARRFQFYLLLVFPLLVAPLALAYLAAYAFDSRAAFYAMLALDAAAGLAAYRVATASAVARAVEHHEEFLRALGQSGGPILTD